MSRSKSPSRSASSSSIGPAPTLNDIGGCRDPSCVANNSDHRIGRIVGRDEINATVAVDVSRLDKNGILSCRVSRGDLGTTLFITSENGHRSVTIGRNNLQPAVAVKIDGIESDRFVSYVDVWREWFPPHECAVTSTDRAFPETPISSPRVTRSGEPSRFKSAAANELLSRGPVNESRSENTPVTVIEQCGDYIAADHDDVQIVVSVHIDDLKRCRETQLGLARLPGKRLGRQSQRPP